MSEREEVANVLRGLIAAYKAFKCERESCLASIRTCRAGLLEQNLRKIVAAVDRDLANTVAEIGRVSDRLLELAAGGDPDARAVTAPTADGPWSSRGRGQLSWIWESLPDESPNAR